ncbi:MAG TPA: EamA family transporter [Thermoanaerobaculia bacterium]
MTSSRLAPSARGVLLVLAAALLWSTGGIAIKSLQETPLKIAFYRCAFAAVALLALLRPRVARWTAEFLIAMGGYAACLITFVVATRWTTAANAIFLQYSGVVWVLLFSPVVLHEPFRRRDAVAIAFALGGMALFFVGKLSYGGAGDWIALLSGVFFAVLVVSLRKQGETGARAAVTYGNVLGAAALLPFVANDLALTPRSAAILGFLGVFQIALAYVLFVAGLQYVTATQASLIGMVEPVCNPIWVFLAIGERPGAYAVAGGIVVLAAVAWRTLSAEPVAPVPPPPD